MKFLLTNLVFTLIWGGNQRQLHAREPPAGLRSRRLVALVDPA